MSSVEALLKRNSPGAAVLGEDPKADCLLITIYILKTVFFLFSCVNWGIMARNLSEHVSQQIALQSTQDDAHCQVARILDVTQGCFGKVLRHNRQQGRPDQSKLGGTISRIYMTSILYVECLQTSLHSDYMGNVCSEGQGWFVW